MSFGGASLGTAEGRITVDTSQAVSSLQSLGSMMSSMDSRAGTMGQGVGQFHQSTVGLAQGMQHLGRVTAGVGVAMAAPFVGAFKAAMDFESSMAGVNAVMDVTDQQFQDLSGLAQQLGADTIYSGNQAAQGIETLGRAGLSFEDIMGGAAQSATDLAAAGGIEVPRAAEVMAAAMQAFNIEGEDSIRVADALAGMANQTLTDVNQLGIGLGQVAGVADAAGMGLEETTGFIGLLADNGIRGSDAATSMKNAILSLLSPTDKAQELMAGMGVSVLDAEGNFIGLADASQEFFDAWQRSGQTMEQFMDPLNDIVGRDAVRTLLFGMQAIEEGLAGGEKGWQSYLDAAGEVGAAHEFAEARMDSTAGAIEKLRGSLTTLGENMGKPMVEGIRPFVEGADLLVDALAGLPPSITGTIGVLGGLTGAVVAAGGAFLVVGGYVLEAVARFGAAGISIASILGPIAALAAGLALLGAAVIAYQKNFLGFADAVNAVKDAIGGLLGVGVEAEDEISKTSDSAAESGREWNGLEESILGVSNTLSRSSIPAIKSFGKWLNTNLVEGMFQARKVWEDMTEKGVNPLTAGLLAASKFTDILTGIAPHPLTDAFRDLGLGIAEFGGEWDRIKGILDTRGIDGLTASLEATAVAWEEAFGPGGIPDLLHNAALVTGEFMRAWQLGSQAGLAPIPNLLGAIGRGINAMGMPGLAADFYAAAEASRLFGDSFAQYRNLFESAGFTGLSSSILAAAEAFRLVTGIDLTGWARQAATAIEALNDTFWRAQREGANPFQAALMGIDAALDTILSPEQQAQLDALAAKFEEVATAVGDFVGAGLDRAVQFFDDLGNAISQGDFSGAADVVRGLFEDIRAELQRLGGQALDWVLNVGAPELAGWAREQAGNFGGWLMEQMGNLGSLAGETLAKVEGWWLEVGEPTLRGWVNAAIGWLQLRLNEFIPAAGEVLGNVAGWILEVGVPEIQMAAGEAGSIKDQLIKWVDEQVVFPDVDDLPDLTQEVETFAANLSRQMTEAIASIGETIQAEAPNSMGGPGERGEVSGAIEASGQETGRAIAQALLRGVGIGIAEGADQQAIAEAIRTGDGSDLKTQVVEEIGSQIAEIPGAVIQTVKQTENDFRAIGDAINGVMEYAMEPVRENLEGDGPMGDVSTRGQQMTAPIEAAFDEMVRGIGAAAAALPGKIAGLLPGNPFDDLANNLQRYADDFGTAVQKASDTVMEALNNFGELTGEPAVENAAALNATGATMLENVVEPIKEGIREEGVAQEPQFTSTFGQTLDRLSMGVLGELGDVWERATQGASAAGADGAEALMGGTFSGLMGGIPAEVAEGVSATGDVAVQSTQDAIGKFDLGGKVATGMDTTMAGQMESVTLAEFSQAIGTTINDAILEGVSGTANTMGGPGERGEAGTASAGIGSQISQMLTSQIAETDFTAVGEGLAQKINSALSSGMIDGGEQTGKTGDAVGGGIGQSIAGSIATSIPQADFTAVGTAIQTKLAESIQAGMGEQAAPGTMESVGGMAGGIGTAIAGSLAQAIPQADFTAVGTALQTKITEALSTGLATTDTAGQQGMVGADAAAGGIGTAIATQMASAIGIADFTAVGTAIQAKISESLSTGLASGDAAQGAGQAAGGAATGIGTSVAASLASSITSADFTAVGAAISAKISEALAAGMAGGGGGGNVATGTGTAAAGIGASIAASIAAEVQAADFSAIGTSIAARIGEALASTTLLSGAMTTMVTAAIQAGVQAAASAVQVGQMIATHAGSGAAAAQELNGAVNTMVTAAIQAGVAATSGATEIGTSIGTHAGSGAASATGLNGGVETMVSAAVQTGVSASSAATEIGTMIAANAGSGAASATELNGAVETMVGAAIDAGVAAAAGASAIGAAISSGAASGVIVTALNGVVAQMVTNGIAAGMAAAGAASPSKKMMQLGEWMSEGLAIGVRNNADMVESATQVLVSGMLGSLAGLGDSVNQLEGLALQFEGMEGGEAMANQIRGIAASLSDSTTEIRSEAEGLVQDMRDLMDELAKVGKDGGERAGRAVGEGLSSGIESSRRQVRRQIRRLQNDIERDIRDAMEAIPAITEDHQADVGEMITGLGEMDQDISKLRDAAAMFDKIAGAEGMGDAFRGIADDIESKRNDAVTAAHTLYADIDQIIQDRQNDIKETAAQLAEDIINTLGPKMKDAAKKGGDEARGIGDSVKSGLESGSENLTNTATNMGEDVGQSLTEGITSQYPSAEEAASGLIDQVSTGLSGASAPLDSAATTVGTNVVEKTTSAMDTAATGAEGEVTSMGTGLGESFGSGLAAGAPPQDAMAMVRSMQESIRTSVASAVPQVQSAGTSVGKSFTTGVDSVNPTQAGVGLVKELGAGVEQGLGSAAGQAVNAGGAVGDAVQEGINETCGAVNDAGTDLTQSCVPDGINSGLGQATNAASKAGGEISDSLVNGLNIKKSDVKNQFSGAGKDFGGSLGSGIGSMSNDAKNASGGLATAAGQVDGSDEGRSVGESIGQGIKEGIESMVQEIADAAADAVRKAEEAAKDEAKTSSPSRLFAAIGRDLSLGMALGIGQEVGSVISAMSGVVSEGASVLRDIGLNATDREFHRGMRGYVSAIDDNLLAITESMDRTDRAIALSSGVDRSASRGTGVRKGFEKAPAPVFQIGGIELKEGQAGYSEGVDFVRALQRTSGQYTRKKK